VKVVLLHPLPLDARAWDGVTAGLDHEAIAPTMYALGENIEQWADAILASAGSDTLTVVGNSVGGSCAIEIARLAPTQVRHLILIGTKPGHRPDPGLRDDAIGVLRRHGALPAWRTYWEPLVGPAADEAIRLRLTMIARQQSVSDLIRGVSVFHRRPDRATWLRSWPGPVTIIAGEHDATSQAASATAAGLKNGRFTRIRGTGHYVPVEAPIEIARIIGLAARDAA